MVRGKPVRVRRLRAAAVLAAAVLPTVGCLPLTGCGSLPGAPTTTTTRSGGAASVPAPVAPVGVGGTWNLSTDDEFNGTSLDANRWSVGEPWNAAPGFVQSEQSWCPLPQNGLVGVADGSLQLKAVVSPSHGKPVQSCFVTSRNKYSFTHGYIEARVKMPAGAGLWPAFWLLGNGTGAQGWPGTGEIDMFELVNNGHDNGVPFFTVHWAGNCPGGHCQKTQSSPYPAVIPNYASRWVTYGMRRTSDSLTIYVDGHAQETFSRTSTNAQGQQLAGVLFDNPMHVRFDLSAGGWAADPSHPTQPGTFAVDYLRAWTS
jgi:beta-glucanase (GH16 family)